jgi:hypothetical protein
VPQPLPDTSAATVRHAVQVRDTRGPAAAFAITRWLRWLRELVAGSAAAGGMPPAPVSASQPSAQAAAELAADGGHRRAGERAGLLKAEVVALPGKRPGTGCLGRRNDQLVMLAVIPPGATQPDRSALAG